MPILFNDEVMIAMQELKSSKKRIVGLKQTVKAIKDNKAKKVYIAKDADEYIKQSVLDVCSQSKVEIVYVDTMKELGEACGIEINASAAALPND